MKAGIISDTHDDLESVRKAISIFNGRRVEIVIHAGDYVFPGIVEEFRKLQGARLAGVLGNNDGEKFGLLKKFGEIGGELKPEFAELELGGLRAGVYHGTDEKLREAAIRSGLYDVFVHGHTHVKRNERVGKTLVLNPGTTRRGFPKMDGGFEDEPAVIIFDTAAGKAEFVNLPK